MGGSVLRRVSLVQAWLALLVAVGVMFGSFSGPSSANANPRYAALVVDARNGEVLFSRHANAPRFPASLTKVMTLYILFEELEGWPPFARYAHERISACPIPTAFRTRIASGSNDHCPRCDALAGHEIGQRCRIGCC